MQRGHRGVSTAVGVVKGQDPIFISAGEDGKICVYRQQNIIEQFCKKMNIIIITYLMGKHIACGQSITSLKIQNEENKFFTATTSGNLHFWDVNEGKNKPTINVKGYFNIFSLFHANFLIFLIFLVKKVVLFIL